MALTGRFNLLFVLNPDPQPYTALVVKKTHFVSTFDPDLVSKKVGSVFGQNIEIPKPSKSNFSLNIYNMIIIQIVFLWIGSGFFSKVGS